MQKNIIEPPPKEAQEIPFDHYIKNTTTKTKPPKVLSEKDWLTIKEGDCRNKLEEIENNVIHLVIADPPYFLDGLGDDWDEKKIQKRKSKASLIGGMPVGMRFDTKQGIRLQEFYSPIAEKIKRILKPGAFFLSFSSARLFHRLSVAVEDAGFEIRGQIAWHYTNKSQPRAAGMNHLIKIGKNLTEEEKQKLKKELVDKKTPQLRTEFESILLAQKPKEGTHAENWIKWRTGLINSRETLNGKIPSTVMHVDKPHKEKYNSHLTAKPVMLIEHLIKLFSCEDQIVLDPFLGSGTTAIAAQRSKRKCIGIEINPEYIKIANQRLKENKNDTY